MSTTINGTTGITFNDSSTQATAATGFGFKNRIINGAMVIDQRNAGASVTIPITTTQYTLDRWFVQASAASKYTVQRNAGSVTPPAGYSNYLGVTVAAAANVTVGASDYYDLIQPVEGYNVADFAFGTASAAAMTISFWVRSSLTGTFSGSVRNGSANRSYPFSYTISSANTWEQKTVTIAGDTTGTWATDNTAGLNLTFSLGVGSTYSGTAGAWIGTNIFSVTGSVKLIETNSATFYITGVQLEKGSTATSFDYRPIGTELSLCQRYYEILTFGPTGASYPIFGTYYNASLYMGKWDFKQTKRASPTVAAIGSWNNTPTIVPAIDACFFYTTVVFYLSGTASTSAIYASIEL